eukprot:scaffold137664_cov27-Tisochrysis_lutea.AAC.4
MEVLERETGTIKISCPVDDTFFIHGLYSGMVVLMQRLGLAVHASAMHRHHNYWHYAYVFLVLREDI